MPRSARLAFFILGCTALLGVGAYWLTVVSSDTELRTSVSVPEALATDTTGYRRATEVRPFSFPRDHGPHPGYKTEWWYVTGTLTGSEAQPYGC